MTAAMTEENGYYETENTFPHIEVPELSYPRYWHFEFSDTDVHFYIRKRPWGLLRNAIADEGNGYVYYHAYNAARHRDERRSEREIIIAMNKEIAKVHSTWQESRGQFLAQFIGPYLPKGTKVTVKK